MGETLNWSPGLLYEEEATTLPQVCFRYPSREQSAAFLVMTAVGGIGLLLWYFTDRGNGLMLGLAGAFTLIMAILALLSIWNQRLLMIDRDSRQITYISRNPFRSRVEFVQAAHLRQVRVDQGADPEPGEERKYHVFLERMNGERIFLGGDEEEDAVLLGRRLSELLKIPLAPPPSDNLRPD